MFGISKYEKVKKLDFSQWVVTKFYHYTSWVGDVINEYDPTWHQKPVGDKYLEEMYDHFQLVADTYLRIHTGSEWGSLGNQNKTVIEIHNITTGDVLYIGRYDGVYRLGKSVKSEFNHFETFGIIRK